MVRSGSEKGRSRSISQQRPQSSSGLWLYQIRRGSPLRAQASTVFRAERVFSTSFWANWADRCAPSAGARKALRAASRPGPGTPSEISPTLRADSRATAWRTALSRRGIPTFKAPRAEAEKTISSISYSPKTSSAMAMASQIMVLQNSCLFSPRSSAPASRGAQSRAP